MKAKNFDTIKTLISMSQTDGNYLGTSWVEMLKCISQLELAQMIGTGVKNQFLAKSPSGPTIPESAFNFIAQAETLLGQPGQQESQMYKESLTETSSQSVVVAVDRIFTGSTQLDGHAVVDFVRALCQVSIEELAVTPHPRLVNFYNSLYSKVAN